MSGTEEVPGTRPTDKPKPKENWYDGTLDFISYFLPILLWIGLGLIILKVADY